MWRGSRGKPSVTFWLECGLLSSLLSAGKREFMAETATKEFFRVTLTLKRQVGEEQKKEGKNPILFKTIQ